MNSHEAHAEILRRLRARHSEDISDAEVYVPSGRGAGAGSQRMDFYSIACSWANPNITAYEVKVSRQDFVRDNKWPAYLPCCHHFVFVTAPGVCKLDEIPAEAGWHELSANGKVLLTRKKAPRRSIEANTEALIYKHLLMRHAKRGVPTRDQWLAWMEQKRADRELGKAVGKEIRHTIRERIESVDSENKRLQSWCEGMEEMATVLKALGVDPDEVRKGDSWRIQQKLRRVAQASKVSTALQGAEALINDLRATANRIESVQKAVTEELKDEAA